MMALTQLKLTEENFWEYSPRKFFALIIAHNEFHTPKEEKEKEVKVLFADDIAGFL